MMVTSGVERLSVDRSWQVGKPLLWEASLASRIFSASTYIFSVDLATRSQGGS